jgi:hypothetical protein
MVSTYESTMRQNPDDDHQQHRREKFNLKKESHVGSEISLRYHISKDAAVSC